MTEFQKNIWSADRVILQNVLPLDMPLCICIEPSNICNFKCAMCFHGNNENDERAAPLKNMDMYIFDKIINDVQSWGRGRKIKLIKLYSLGEPLIHPYICDMVKKIKASNICNKIEITTNASLLDVKTAEKLVDYGLDVLRVSVYSVLDKRMKFVTRSSTPPSVIYDNVSYLRRYRDDKKSNLLICAKMLDSNDIEENKKFIEQYSKISDEVGIDEVFATNLGEGNDAFVNLYGKDAQNVHQKSLESNIVETQNRRACRYPFTHMTIRSDGSVITCCSDWIKELKYGNVAEHPLEELWKSRNLFKIRCDMLKSRGTKWETCRYCEIPFRDSLEDNINNISPEIFTWQYDFKDIILYD